MSSKQVHQGHLFTFSTHAAIERKFYLFGECLVLACKDGMGGASKRSWSSRVYVFEEKGRHVRMTDIDDKGPPTKTPSAERRDESVHVGLERHALELRKIS